MFSYIVYNYTWSVFDVIVVMQKKRSGFGVGDARHQAIIKKTAARPRGRGETTTRPRRKFYHQCIQSQRNKMMRSIAFLVLAVVAVSVSAFTGTPLQIARPSVAANRANGSSSLVMRERACDLLGKTANRKARVVTFSHKRIHKVQQVNLQWKRFYSGGCESLIEPGPRFFTNTLCPSTMENPTPLTPHR